MYEPGYEFSPMERQQQQQQHQILQKLDSALFFQDALRVAAYHPYNSPSALYANSPLGGFTAAAAGFTPSSTFAAAALNVLSAIPPASQFAHMQQQQQQQLQSTENGSMTRNNNDPTSIIDESQPIPSSVGGITSSITPQNISRPFNFYDLPSQIDSPQQGFTPNYFPPTSSVAASGTNLMGSNFNRQNSQQQQQQQQASTSSANADYSFSSVAAALKNKGLHANVQQYYESPRNFGPSGFMPYISQPVGPSGFQSFMQAASDSLKQPIFFTENEEGSPMHFLQTPVQQFQESITPRQIFNPGQHHIQSSFQPPQQSQQHQQASQMILQPQSNRQGLNLLQQQQQMKQLQRYNQEKAILQQQQYEIQQQARLESQQKFQNTSSNNEQVHNQSALMQQEEQTEKQQINLKQENNSGLQNQVKSKQQKKLMNPQEDLDQITGNVKQQVNQKSSNTLGSGKQDSNASQTCQTHVNISLVNPAITSDLGQKGSNEQKQLQKQIIGYVNVENEEDDEDEGESIEEDEETEGKEKEDEDDGDDNDEDEEDEDYCQDGKKRSKKQDSAQKHCKSKIGARKHKKISKNKNHEANGAVVSRTRKQINETKNIPKNYSKAIIGFIQKHPDECSSLLGKDYSFTEFEQFLVDRKEKLTAIKDLRSLWTAKAENPKLETFNRVFRILSFKFFRENAVAYIYSSRKIKNTKALITYRFILQRALHDPESFQFMKLQN